MDFRYLSREERERINAENKAKLAAREEAKAIAADAKRAARRQALAARAARMKETSCGHVEETGNPRAGCDCQACDRRRKAKSARQRARRKGQDPDAHWAGLPDGMPNYRQERFEQYGITEADYRKMLEDQGYSCAICGTKKPGGRGAMNSWHIDHDHKTGKVRGLLCRNCNWGLGQFKDSIDNLRAAINYLSED